MSTEEGTQCNYHEGCRFMLPKKRKSSEKRNNTLQKDTHAVTMNF